MVYFTGRISTYRSGQRPTKESSNVQRFFTLLGMTVGGWAIGAQMSIFVAFLLSLVGTAAGLYLGRKITKSLGG